MYVPGRGKDLYFKVSYSGVGKSKVTFTSHEAAAHIQNVPCQVRTSSLLDPSNLTTTCLNGDKTKISDDTCMCAGAWKKLLTGGPWYVVNNTAAQRKIQETSYYSYNNEVVPTNNEEVQIRKNEIGCAPFTFPEAPTNARASSVGLNEITISWSIDSYDKGGRFTLPSISDSHLAESQVSTKSITLEYSTSSDFSTPVSLSLPSLKYWCVKADKSTEIVLGTDQVVDKCRKCNTNSDCGAAEICNTGKVDVLKSPSKDIITNLDFPYCGQDTQKLLEGDYRSVCSEYHKFKECRPNNPRSITISSLKENTKYYIRLQITNTKDLVSAWSDTIVSTTECSTSFPAGFCNCDGTLMYDACNVCDGPGIKEGRCDCNDNVNDICGVCGGSGIAAGYCDCAKTIKLPDGKSSSYCNTLISLTSLQDTGAANNNRNDERSDGSGNPPANQPAKCSTISALKEKEICSGGTYTGYLKDDKNQISCIGTVCGNVDKVACCANPTPFSAAETEKRLDKLSNFTTDLNSDEIPRTNEELEFNKYVRETVITAVIETIPPENPNSTDTNVWELIGATASKPEELSLDSSENLGKIVNKCCLLIFTSRSFIKYMHNCVFSL